MKPLKYGYLSLKLALDCYTQKYSRDLCWELSLAFCSTQLSTQVPSLSFKKVLPPKHPCHTWGSRLGTSCEVISPNFHSMLSMVEIAWIDLKWLGIWDPLWTGPWTLYQCEHKHYWVLLVPTRNWKGWWGDVCVWAMLIWRWKYSTHIIYGCSVFVVKDSVAMNGDNRSRTRDKLIEFEK